MSYHAGLRTRLQDNARDFLENEAAQGLHKKLWEIAENEAEHIRLTPEDYATDDYDTEVQEA